MMHLPCSVILAVSMRLSCLWASLFANIGLKLHHIDLRGIVCTISALRNPLKKSPSTSPEFRCSTAKISMISRKEILEV